VRGPDVSDGRSREGEACSRACGEVQTLDVRKRRLREGVRGANCALEVWGGVGT